MLEQADVAFEIDRPNVDEDAAKAALAAAGTSARDTADALAQLKAIKVSARHPRALVLGSDSVVELDHGILLDKPVDRADAADHLRRLSGHRHRLHSAAVIVEDGRPVWREVDTATLFVRPLSDAFIDAYLDAEWPAIAGCVGCYRIEGPGAQLFARIDGSQFTILGLPLLPVLDYLRVRGVLTS
ncbi:Maf family protein [Sphingomonas donggukensis]|uniref:Nucleoside triphosphate pyrophosphatase n=1 Tax=Sphingomonas donggukensis TaxID=2949093 RepID=A0ABY4TZG2_9SPHN|nr:nucleoside triphosphate pyrophosphatase [Sphingomonas donggukensis]URW77041.1 Maf family protein [Sphingomonas donggukensis]